MLTTTINIGLIRVLSNGFLLSSMNPDHLSQTKSRNESLPDHFSTVCITATLTHRADKTSEIHRQFQTPTEHGCLVSLTCIGQKQSDPPPIAVLFLRCVPIFLLLIMHYCCSARTIAINGRFQKPYSPMDELCSHHRSNAHVYKILGCCVFAGTSD